LNISPFVKYQPSKLIPDLVTAGNSINVPVRDFTCLLVVELSENLPPFGLKVIVNAAPSASRFTSFAML